jgi:hypothetical protein
MRPPRRERSAAFPLVAGLLMVVLAAGIVLGTIAILDAGLGSVVGLGTRPGSPVARTSSPPAPGGSPSGTLIPGGAGSLPPAASTGPDVSPQPSVGPVLDPPAAPGPFSIDLYRKGAFVSELKPIWCVPAAMQTSINIMESGPPDRTFKTQQKLYNLARRLSTDKLTRDGAEPEGWAEGLNQLGYGPYVVAVAPSRKTAVEQAAIALRMTGRPVGLLTWKGAHSWVMSGFTATADPAWTSDFKVTGLYVEDVWFPAVSRIWGPSLPPDTLDPIEKLSIDFLPWRRPTARYPDKDGRFVMVLPSVGQ